MRELAAEPCRSAMVKLSGAMLSRKPVGAPCCEVAVKREVSAVGRWESLRKKERVKARSEERGRPSNSAGGARAVPWIPSARVMGALRRAIGKGERSRGLASSNEKAALRSGMETAVSS